MPRQRLITYAAIGAGVAVVVAVGIAAFLSLQSPFQAPTNPSGTTSCDPHPCIDVRGYSLWVSDLKVESGLVTMNIKFRNASSATHADPADIQLVDSQNRSSRAIHDAPGCSAWPRTDFGNGATFGPVPECFRPASTSPPLTLHWSPDMGFLCCDVDLVLQGPGDVGRS